MRIVKRYISSEILGATLLVFATLLSLFAFFDLIHELADLGKGNYRLSHVLVYVLLSVPGHVYELFPVAVLIGTLFALATLVANSEYTVMRVSGLSVSRSGWILLQIGALFALLTFTFGEFIAPPAERAAKQLRLRAMSMTIAQEFRSGIWVKDDTRFVNIQSILPDTTLIGLKIYEFDRDYQLRTVSFAAKGEYVKDNRWKLEDVVQTMFNADGASIRKFSEGYWLSEINPDILSVLLVVPDQMSAWSLYSYVQHLKESKQNTERYETAFWTKVIYPVAVMVMMLLALPFSYYQRREGGVGTRIFWGIVLGLVFHLLNRLIAHLGVLNDWPPFLSAFLPTLMFMGLALGMIWWVERR